MAFTTGGKPSISPFSSRRFLWRMVSHTLSVHYYRASTEVDGSDAQDSSVEEDNRSVMGGVSVRDTDIEVGPFKAAMDGLSFVSVEPSDWSSQVRSVSAAHKMFQGLPLPEQETQISTLLSVVGGNPKSSQSVLCQEFVLFGNPPCQFWVQVLVPLPLLYGGLRFRASPPLVR